MDKLEELQNTIDNKIVIDSKSNRKSKSTLKQLGEIIEGYKNLAKKKLGIESTEVSDIYSEREKICKACDKVILNNDVPTKCSLCGCQLQAKLRSLQSSCPENKW